MLGYELSEIKMDISTWQDNVHPDDLSSCFEDINNYLEGKTESYENVHRSRHKDGHWVYILGKGKFSQWDESGKPTRFTGTNLDISEAKKAESDKVQEFSQMFSSTPSCFKIMNNDGIVIYMNPRGLELLGLKTLEEILNQSYYDFVAKEYKEKFISFHHGVCEDSKNSFLYEIVTLQGERKWMETFAAPYKVIGAQSVSISITNDVTKRVVDEREHEHQKIISFHSAKLASLGELAAGVGHEINNPLAIAKGHISMIFKSIQDGRLDEKSFIKSLKKIDHSIERVSKITKGLKTFSRNDQNQLDQVDLSQIIMDSVDLVEEIYLKDNIKFHVNLIDHVYINANRSRLEQVFINLFSNAKDAMKKKTSKHIYIDLHVSNRDIVHLYIKDTGEGIPSGYQDKIFDPFFTSKGVNEGTGIGLALSYQIISELDGQLLLESTSSQGSTFCIKLKIIDTKNAFSSKTQDHTKPQDSRTENDQVREQKNPSKEKGVVLVLEDEDDIREILEYMLNDLGYEMIGARNGQEGLALYQEHSHRLSAIMTDMQMPIMNGLDFLEQLHEKSQDPPPCFVITGGVNHDFEDKTKGLGRLIEGYISKPFTSENLSVVLSKIHKHKKIA